jgi:hypothetical protein
MKAPTIETTCNGLKIGSHSILRLQEWYDRIYTNACCKYTSYLFHTFANCSGPGKEHRTASTLQDILKEFPLQQSSKCMQS